jgi:hypothetical protein
MKTYCVKRFYRDPNNQDHGRIIKRHLTLEEAKDHCRSEESHQVGKWFDGYEEE